MTGHTGFKGAWLTEWLLLLGAEVRGYSLAAPTTPSLFAQLGLAGRISHQLADVRDRAALVSAVREFAPDFVFHLAAQPLVRQSHAEPAATYETNVLGTVNVLEALRGLRSPCAAVFVTSDKCYANRDIPGGYKEDAALGGDDPYSSSKAAAEIAIAAWRNSFFSPEAVASGRVAPVGVASGRAGNVIGGGDWAADRIVPDCIRSLSRDEVILVRNPESIRPWQHVLESLSGYLHLGARLHTALSAAPEGRGGELARLAAAFNFGPGDGVERTVRELVEEVLRHWPGRWERRFDAAAPSESWRLHLDSARAREVLGWRPRWDFQRAVVHTVTWYRAVAEKPAVAPELTRRQIREYMAGNRA